MPNYVHAYEPFQAQWRAIWANTAPTYNDPNWRAFGTSSNAMYVTYGKSLATAYHTLVYNATISASGHSTWQKVLDANWEPFGKYNIAWKEPKPADQTIPGWLRRLFYYGNWDTPNTSHTTLLADGDGQCRAWAEFWRNEILVQGITEAVPVLVNILPLHADGFLIKNWTGFVNQTSGDHDYPYKATWPLGSPTQASNTELAQNKYRLSLTSDFLDAEGVRGQGTDQIGVQPGNPNPKADFNSHYVIAFNDRIYDPSYGRDYASIGAWEDGAIVAFFKNVYLLSEWKAKLNMPNTVEVLTYPPVP